MSKIRHELATWEEGRAFMNRLADDFGGKVEEVEEDLRLHHDDFTANCNFDLRDFSFIYIKLQNEDLAPKIKSLLAEFEENKR